MRQARSRARLSPRRVLGPLRRSRNASRDRPAGVVTRPRILVVEDEEGAREALVLLLACFGYDVMSASNGSEALEQVTDLTPDLVVTDWRMPGMSGSTLCLALRKRRHTMPIIVVTSAEEVFTTEQPPVDARLRKPIDPTVLVREISEALRLGDTRETAI